MSKVIITAAITGSIHTPTMSPYLPVTPDQISDNAVQAREAGAAVVHIHVRNPETGQPTPDLGLFREVLGKIKSKSDLIICTTTGGGFGQTPEQRVAVVPTFRPELASFNMGTMNFGLFPVLERMKEFKFPWEKLFLEATEDVIAFNSFKSMKVFFEKFNENQTKPELEVYDAGMINTVGYFIDKGLLKTPVYIQFVLGILGGMAATVQNLVILYESACRQIGEKNFVWSVCAAGVNQMPMCTTSLLMGGNARVGMEDALRLSKGKLAKHNGELVEKIVRIGREFGLEPATPAEARKMLGLKGLDKVAY